MHYAVLDGRLGPGRGDGLGQAFEPIAAGDQDVLDTPVLQLRQHGQPLPGALPTAGRTGPQTQEVAFTLDGDPQGHVGRPVGDLTFADLGSVADLVEVKICG
jgi:hypothetical protein